MARRGVVGVILALLFSLNSTLLQAAEEESCVVAEPQSESDSFKFLPSLSHQLLEDQVPLGVTIRSIRIKRFKVFDMEDPEENGTLYRWANEFHFNTRESVIQDQLLFDSGDVYIPAQARETERILRDLKFIFDAEVRPWRWCGEEVDLEVITRDIWTFTPVISLSRSGGENELTLGFRDANFLGSGKQVGLRYESDDERSGVNLMYADPAIMGSRWETRVSLTDNDDGHDRQFRLTRPFYSVYERWSAGITLQDKLQQDKIWFRGDEVQEFNHDDDEVNIFAGYAPDVEAEHRVGRWLAGVRMERHRFSYSDSDIPPPELPEDRDYHYPYLGFQSVEDEFIEAQNLDYVGRTEDLFVGEHYHWNLGYSPEALGATRDQLALDGRYGNTLLIDEKNWWVVDTEVTGFWSVDEASFENLWWTTESRYHRKQALKWGFFSRLRVDYTDGLTADKQLTLGGDNGLRGYERHYQVGDRSVLLNLEQRYYSDWHPFRLMRVGFAAFIDVGRAWYPNQDNGENGDVLANAGIGLRLVSSRSDKGSVIHVDLAFPFERGDDVDSMQLLFTVKETF